MVNNQRQFVVNNAFSKMPKPSDFAIAEKTLPPLQKDQFLVKAEYISVDPYQFTFSRRKQVPYPQFGFQVGQVVESQNLRYSIGQKVVAHAGWCDVAVLDGRPDDIFHMVPYQPEISGLPVSLAVGALGMPGMTAYLGLMNVGKPVAGETVCVTSAAGAVGSLVGQIAKIQGCSVIGFAGSDEKVRFLKQDLKFDHSFNYKTEKDVKALLKTAAPSGIDVFFDNVGGDLAAAILECTKDAGRVVICGAISEYIEAKATKANPVIKATKGISFTNWKWDEQLAATKQLCDWVLQKRVIAKETVVNGFEKLPEALIGMLSGAHVGKVVVKV